MGIIKEAQLSIGTIAIIGTAIMVAKPLGLIMDEVNSFDRTPDD